MKNKYNTLHKYIFEYSNSECTKEIINDLFRSVTEPIISEQKAQACILLKIDDKNGKDSILKRLSFSEREIYSYNDNLSDFNIKNVIKSNIWETVSFIIISGKRYSAALLWDFSISETENRAKTMLVVNSKIVSDVIKTIFENSDIENKKDILQKYNADRRENVLLNKSVNNIIGVLNEKTDECLTAKAENSVLNSENDDVATAKKITENARLVAHEIKNNISVVNLYTTILKKRMKNISLTEEDEKSFYNALENIAKATENITGAINELREISLPKKEQIKLYDFISEIISLTDLKLKEKNIKINLNGDKESEILSDKKKLTSVIQNLIINSCDACKKDGIINIDYFEKDNSTIIQISNNGEKIREDLTEKIFERDFTTKDNGNGLGLYICKKITSFLNGDINLLYSNENETKFEIKINKKNINTEVPLFK